MVDLAWPSGVAYSMPTINLYLSVKETEDLLAEARKRKVQPSQLLRQIVREWLISQGYGAK